MLEVRNYYNALLFLDELNERNEIINIELIFKLHNLLSGKKYLLKIIFKWTKCCSRFCYKKHSSYAT